MMPAITAGNYQPSRSGFSKRRGTQQEIKQVRKRNEHWRIDGRGAILMGGLILILHSFRLCSRFRR